MQLILHLEPGIDSCWWLGFLRSCAVWTMLPCIIGDVCACMMNLTAEVTFSQSPTRVHFYYRLSVIDYSFKYIFHNLESSLVWNSRLPILSLRNFCATRMHSSRMRTARFNGHLYGGGCVRGVSRSVSRKGVSGLCVSGGGGVHPSGPRGRHPLDSEADSPRARGKYPLPFPCEQNDW